MIKRIKSAMVTLMAVMALSVPVLVPASVAAQEIDDNLCAGANLSVNNTECDAAGSAQRVNDLLEDVINLFSLVVGVISVIMIIIGGLKYITSAGDSGNVTSAKNTILYAIVGLVIVALAQFIVRFVLSRVA